jgi:hypothetical protein
MTDPALTDIAGVRASDTEREHHADLLREHAAQGRLTVDELEQRLDRVYAARTHGELAPIVEDLPAPRAPRAPRRSARRRPELAAFVAVNLMLIVIWAATGAGYFWPIWPLLGWGLGLIGPRSCWPMAHRRRPQAR